MPEFARGEDLLAPLARTCLHCSRVKSETAMTRNFIEPTQATATIVRRTASGCGQQFHS
jgi:hypothetical protein